MANDFFQFKEFRVDQGLCGMKVTTDGCFFGAYIEAEGAESTLDIGTGTGLLSLMLAQKNPEATIDAIDIEAGAYAQAKANFANSKWANRLRAHHLGIKEFPSENKYDLIVCNPPFFKGNQKGQSDKKNKAIHNDELPMELLAKRVTELLSEAGSCWVMYPEFEMKKFANSAFQAGLHTKTQLTLKNTKDSSVFRTIAEFSQLAQEGITEMTIDIRDAQGEYTDTFRSYLNPYYLHL